MLSADPLGSFWIVFIIIFLRSSREIAIEEVNHLFVSADDDHDDRLSYQEVIENYEVFVGSEATDYGDHLNKLKDEL